MARTNRYYPHIIQSWAQPLTFLHGSYISQLAVVASFVWVILARCRECVFLIWDDFAACSSGHNLRLHKSCRLWIVLVDSPTCSFLNTKLLMHTAFGSTANLDGSHHEDLHLLARGDCQSHPRSCEKSFVIWADSNCPARTFLTALLQPHYYYRAAPPVPGYGVDELQWGFSPPFGEPIFVNGTAQEIRQSLEDAGIMHHVSPDQVARSVASVQERDAAKDAISVKFCGVFPMANSHHVSAQIPAIVTISGPAVIGPGPGNCAQVSCAQISAIWWCNDVGLRSIPHEWLTISDVACVSSATPQSCFLKECSNSETQSTQSSISAATRPIAEYRRTFQSLDKPSPMRDGMSW